MTEVTSSWPVAGAGLRIWHQPYPAKRSSSSENAVRRQFPTTRTTFVALVAPMEPHVRGALTAPQPPTPASRIDTLHDHTEISTHPHDANENSKYAARAFSR